MRRFQTTSTEHDLLSRILRYCISNCEPLDEARPARPPGATEVIEFVRRLAQSHGSVVRAKGLTLTGLQTLASYEQALSQVDDKTATMQADPQSASVAKAIGADQNLIAALSHAVFAISIELGSGVGFWLVFGHGAPSRRRHETDRIASTVLVPIDRGGAVDLQVIDDKPAEIVERFFLEVRPPEAQRSCPVHGGVVCLQTMVRAPRPQRGLTRYVRSAGTLAEGSGWRDRLVPGC